jgi:hypothetical protein
MHQRIRSVIAVTATAALLVGGTVATAGMSGAIFTTDAGGDWVNGNVYDSADLVYLNGGPRANQNCSAAGLPMGDYYFQVTDPSGNVLLSDYGHNNGIISVSVDSGVISGYTPLSPSTVTRLTSSGPCGVTVQLLPVPLIQWPSDPNPGGEYKVWLTPKDRYACEPASSFCGGSFGFISSYSKTDNFKVQPPDGGDPD